MSHVHREKTKDLKRKEKKKIIKEKIYWTS